MPEGNFFFQRLPVQQGPDASFERVISGIAEGQKRLWRVLFPERNLFLALLYSGQMRARCAKKRLAIPAWGERWEGESFEVSWFGALPLSLPFSKEIQPCSPPSPQAWDWGSPGGTGGPQGRTGRLCLEGGEGGGGERARQWPLWLEFGLELSSALSTSYRTPAGPQLLPGSRARVGSWTRDGQRWPGSANLLPGATGGGR